MKHTHKMKHLKYFENIDWNEDDFDEEEYEYGDIKWNYTATLSTFLHFMKNKDIMEWVDNLPNKVMISEVIKQFFNEKIKIVSRIKEYYINQLDIQNESKEINWEDFDEDETDINDEIIEGQIRDIKNNKYISCEYIIQQSKLTDKCYFIFDVDIGIRTVYQVYNAYLNNVSIIMNNGRESNGRYAYKGLSKVELV